MSSIVETSQPDQARALSLSTIAFAACFAVWTLFSIIGVQLKEELGLNETEFGLLVATPILTGSLSRIVLGIWTDQYGGRRVFSLVLVTTSLAVWMLTQAETYPMFLLAALGIGIAGGSFAVGVAYVSRWYDKSQQGTVLGLFGMGNVGAAVTNFGAPFLLVALGWKGVAQVYATIMLVLAVLFWVLAKEDSVILARRASGKKAPAALAELSPLKRLQVWRFSTYYFFVFGGFVALALWLPRYYVGVYELDIAAAGMLAACYSLPGSIFRALGGWLSDRRGARTVMYWTFGACVGCTLLLSYPTTDYVIHGIEGPISFTIGMGLVPFAALTVVLGFFMSLGMAAVYKHIPVYYADNIGSVGGFVGMVGGLGGFVLPISFGLMNDLIGVWTSCFMLLFGIAVVSLTWMHFSILSMEKKLHPQLAEPRDLPELEQGSPPGSPG